MKLLATLLLLSLSVTALAAPVRVSNGRLTEYPDRTQVVFDLSGPVQAHHFMLDDPPRLVVDLQGARRDAGLKSLNLRSGHVRAVRTGVRQQSDLRLVLDLVGAGLYQVFHIPPDARGGHRLVVDVHPPAGLSPVGPAGTLSTPKAQKTAWVPVRRDIVIAIDPGHGGKDPGAIGPRGTREKDVVLAVARHLKTLVDREPGMRAVLTRSNDRYLGLKERINIARKHDADLFLSIHADAAEHARPRGSSVYILSNGRATSEAARLLADRENAADKLGSVRLLEDDYIDRVVLDMQQDANLEASLYLAEQVLDRLKGLGGLFKRRVERASFAVLTSPVMPSILVETAFITTPEEENKLRSAAYQRQLAESIMAGIRGYFRKRPAQELIVVEAPEAPLAPPPGASVAAAPARAVAPAPVAAPRPLPDPAPVSTPPPLVLTATPMAAPDPVPAPRVIRTTAPPPRPKQVHVIQRGESLAQIAASYGISLPALRSVNGLPDNQLRMPAGTRLTIPLLARGG